MSKPIKKSNLDVAFAQAAANYAKGFAGKVSVAKDGKTTQVLALSAPKAVK